MRSRVAIAAVACLAACAGAGTASSRAATAVPPAPSSPGLTPVEGNPPGGLPYRVWAPEAGARSRPLRLAIWLHPSTASFNERVEALAPDLAARGFALLVVTAKDWQGWTGDEARRLLEATAPVAAHAARVDARSPLLVGFSAGGQMALLLWRQRPGAFAGAAVMGAEPVAFSPGGGSREMEPPRDVGFPVAPLWVLEGAAEPGARMWRGVAEDWRAAGVPLALRIAAGRGHEWLLDQAEERGAFLAWVAGLAPAR